MNNKSIINKFTSETKVSEMFSTNQEIEDMSLSLSPNPSFFNRISSNKMIRSLLFKKEEKERERDGAIESE